MNLPENLTYTQDHVWMKKDGDEYVFGITDFAQSELGEIVFIELPEVGKELKSGEVICVAESSKAVSEVYAPIGGVISEVNTALEDDPSIVNNDPYEAGWIVKYKVINENDLQLPKLITKAQYEEFIS